jgi:hypothetical protein
MPSRMLSRCADTVGLLCARHVDLPRHTIPSGQSRLWLPPMVRPPHVLPSRRPGAEADRAFLCRLSKRETNAARTDHPSQRARPTVRDIGENPSWGFHKGAPYACLRARFRLPGGWKTGTMRSLIRTIVDRTGC